MTAGAARRPAALLLLALCWSAGAGGAEGPSPCPARCACATTDRGKRRVACAAGGMRDPLPTALMDAAVEVIDVTAPEDRPNNLTIAPVFQPFKRLEELRISRSNVPQVPMHAFWGVPSLRRLDLSSNRIRAVADHNFRGLLNLLELRLAANRLEAVPTGAFRHLTELRVLDLRANRLRELAPRALVKLAKLRELLISGNAFGELDPETFKDVPDLRVLECRNCSLKRINTQIYHLLPYLTHIDLGNNQFQFVSKDEFHDLRRLQSLRLDGNLLPVILEKTFVNQHQLQLLDVSRNRIVKITDTAFTNLSTLSDLDIGYNKMSKIEAVALSHVSATLQRLVISGNRFSLSTVKAIVDGLVKVTRLEMAHMRIEAFPDDFFPGRIRTLNVSGNNISEVSSAMIPDELVELDLSSNKIEGLNASVVVKLQTLKFVGLRDNPWTCDVCHVNLSLLRENKTNLFENLTCAFPVYLKGRILRYMSPDEVARCDLKDSSEENSRDNSKKGLIIGLICILIFGAFSVIFVVYSCVRRHSRNISRQQKRAAEIEANSVEQATAVFCKEEISFKFPLDLTERKMSVSTIDEIKKDGQHPSLPNGTGVSSC